MAKKQSHSQEQIRAFLQELKIQTDRGAAIIAAAVLDDLLEQMILARLIELGSDRREALFDKTGAPLSSLSAKIEISFALGTISNETRLGLHLIRDVRNAFAHRMEQITFNHPEVSEMIEKRIAPALKRSDTSNRQKLMDSFSAMAMLLYATLQVDIRIHPLEKTHADHFMKFILRVRETMMEATPGPGGSFPASEHPPSKPK